MAMTRVEVKLHLSQDLIIGKHYSISVPGETEHYFGGCDLYGRSDWLPREEVWFALTDKAKEVWRGRTRGIENGVVLGRLFVVIVDNKEQRLARLEALGSIVPGCPGCQEFYDHPTGDPFAPRHKPSDNCESGKHPHCTCDICF